MSKKDYIKIAKVIREQKEHVNDSVLPDEVKQYADIEINIIANKLAIIFLTDNPLFNQEKFCKACGID